MIVAAVYNAPPPKAPTEERLLDYLAHSITILTEVNTPSVDYSFAGISTKVHGVAKITRSTDQYLVNVVKKKPTRRQSSLDVIITNLSQWYQEPEILPPVGRSDHSSVPWRPKARSMINIPRPSITYKRAQPSAPLAAGFPAIYSWKPVLDASSTRAKADTLYGILEQQIGARFPSKKLKVTASDKPWMTTNIKQLIIKRRRAFKKDHSTLWKHYRNTTKRAILPAREHLLNKNCLKPNPAVALGTPQQGSSVAFGPQIVKSTFLGQRIWTVANWPT